MTQTEPRPQPGKPVVLAHLNRYLRLETRKSGSGAGKLVQFANKRFHNRLVSPRNAIAQPIEVRRVPPTQVNQRLIDSFYPNDLLRALDTRVQERLPVHWME